MSLGYHETLGSTEAVPSFLIDIRRTAFCRAYSADKNWAIFLGRPPRLAKKYCNLQAALRQCSSTDADDGPHSLSGHQDTLRWRPDSDMSIWSETRWTAACAAMKEEILEMFRDNSRERFDDRVRYVRLSDQHAKF